VSTLELSIPSPLALTVSPALAARGPTLVILCALSVVVKSQTRKQRDRREKSHGSSPPLCLDTNCIPSSGWMQGAMRTVLRQIDVALPT
jgi:hypothetical protein